jgi:PAS domain S-box-containing protein
MEEYLNEISRIRNLLEDHPEGLSITDISGQLHMNRNSVAKYMDILQMQGSVDGRKKGTSKVFYLSERLLAESIRKVCTRPFLIINQNGKVIDCNQMFSDFTGVPKDEMLNWLFEVLPFKFLEGGTAQEVLKTSLKGMEQRVRAQVLLGTKTIPVTLLLIPVVFETGKPGVSVIVDDSGAVSGKSSAETASSDFLAILDNQIEYIVRHTPEGIISYVNEPYFLAVGKTREELIGRLFKPIVSPEDAEKIKNRFSRLTVQNPVGMIEYRTVMAKGEARWQRWLDRALFNNRGECSGYISCGIDITDLVFAQQRLKKTKDTLEETIINRTNELQEINRHLYTEMAERERIEQQLLHTQFAMDNAADMVFWINRNARVHYANKAAIQFLGYTADQLFDIPFGNIFPTYSLTKWDSAWERLKTEGKIASETSILRKDESQVPVEVVIKYLEYHGNEFACCFSRDISDRTRMEHSLQMANRKLNVFTSIARHDIQNKITVLLGFLGRTKKKVKDPVILGYLEKQEQAAKAISDEITMTRDFKDLGIDPPKWLNVREIVMIVMIRYKDSPVLITNDLPDLEVYADGQLGRVFVRVLENAVNYGHKTTEIRISAIHKEAYLVIAVESSGEGIRPEDKERIFELQDGGSLHRGLFIAREILSLTGITLHETGEYGKGTRFEMVIPPAYFRSPH